MRPAASRRRAASGRSGAISLLMVALASAVQSRAAAARSGSKHGRAATGALSMRAASGSIDASGSTADGAPVGSADVVSGWTDVDAVSGSTARTLSGSIGSIVDGTLSTVEVAD
jgi:hypothetical protein